MAVRTALSFVVILCVIGMVAARACSEEEEASILAYLQCNVEGCKAAGRTRDVGHVPRTDRGLFGSQNQVKGLRCSPSTGFLDNSGFNVNQGYFNNDFGSGEIPFYPVDLAALSCSDAVRKAVFGSEALQLNERNHFFSFMYVNSYRDGCDWGKTAKAYIKKAYKMRDWARVDEAVQVPRGVHRGEFSFRDVPYTMLLSKGDVTNAKYIFEKASERYGSSSYAEKEDLCQASPAAISACYDPKAQLAGKIRPEISRVMRRVSDPEIEARYKELKQEKKRLEEAVESVGMIRGLLTTPEEVTELEGVVAELTILKEKRKAIKKAMDKEQGRLDVVNEFLRSWEGMGCTAFQHPRKCNMP